MESEIDKWKRMVAGMTCAIGDLWGDQAIMRVLDKMREDDRRFAAMVASREQRARLSDEATRQRRVRYAEASRRVNRPKTET